MLGWFKQTGYTTYSRLVELIWKYSITYDLKRALLAKARGYRQSLVATVALFDPVSAGSLDIYLGLTGLKVYLGHSITNRPKTGFRDFQFEWKFPFWAKPTTHLCTKLEWNLFEIRSVSCLYINAYIVHIYIQF